MKRLVLVIGSLVVLLILATLGFIFGRQAWAARQADQEWQNAALTPISDLGSTRTLSILPLWKTRAAVLICSPSMGSRI
jgi:hypothetical protein